MGHRPLTPQEAIFVAEYIKDFDPKAAAARAKYAMPEKQGPRIIKKPKIKAAIEEEKKKQIDRIHIDADVVLRELWRVYQKACGVAPAKDGHGRPAKDEEGNIIYKEDLNAQLKALDQISKHVAVDAVASSKSNVNVTDDTALAAKLMAKRRMRGKPPQTANGFTTDKSVTSIPRTSHEGEED